MTESLAQHLACLDCGAVHALGYRLECEKCRGLLELRYDLAPLRARGPGLLTGRGLWRYAPVLPIAVQDTPGPAWGVVVVDRRVPFFERAGSGSAQPVTDGFSPWELGLEVDVERFRSEVRRLFGG